MSVWSRLADEFDGRQFDRFVQVVVVLMAAKILLVRHVALGRAFGYGAITDILFVCGVGAAVSLLNGRRARRTIALVDVVFSIACWATILYAMYFEQLPGLSLLSLSSQASQLGDDLASLVSWTDLLLVVDLPFVLWGAFRGVHAPSGSHFARVFVAASAIAVTVVLSVVAAAFPVSRGSLAGSYQYGITSYELAMVLRGQSGADLAVPERALTLQEQIDKLTGRANAGRKPGAPAWGAFRGSNVIMIQVEALQSRLVGARIDGQPIVPNLEKLIARSHYYPNTYSQIGRGNTSDAEFIANTSLYPAIDRAACQQYAAKVVPSLPRILADRGYTSLTFHTNYATFWNRFQMYPALGFSHFCDRTYFGDDDVIGFGPSDGVLYSKSLPIIYGEISESRPVYAHMITVSSHHPFKYFADHGPLDLRPDVASTITGRYLQSQAYADARLGEFISEITRTGVLDETILVVYGDHFGMRFSGSEEDAAVRRELFGREYNKADYYNIPLVVALPGQVQPMVDEDPMGQIDIMPTLADLLGVNLDDVPHFGRSAFVRTPTLLTRPSTIGTYIDDDEVCIEGLTSEDDLRFSSRTQLPMIGVGASGQLSNAAALLELSESYGDSLPVRESATTEEGYIPSKDQDITGTPWQ